MHFYESYDSYIRLTYAIIERKIGKILLIGRATAIVGKRNYCACAKRKGIMRHVRDGTHKKDEIHENDRITPREKRWGKSASYRMATRPVFHLARFCSAIRLQLTRS